MFIVFYSDHSVQQLGFALQYSTSYGKIKYSKAISSDMSVRIYKRVHALAPGRVIVVSIVVLFECSFYCICRVVECLCSY
jgi:hypothetical protein